MWARSKVPNGDLVKAVYEDLENLPKHNMKIEDPNPPFHADRNPLQTSHHMAAETEAVAAHLKRSLELVVAEVFSRARAAAMLATTETMAEPLKVRWTEAYFPFTSPSWELEIFWQGDWLEVLGCGIVKQDLLIKAGVSDQMGWAFGVGLERIAMLLFDIPDIRLFWSKDERFTKQFEGLSDSLDRMKRFSSFSKHPACYKDVAFWLCSSSPFSGNGSLLNPQAFHENDLMELVRDIGGNLVENVTMVDKFTHPKTSRKSLCYRISYRSLERTLTNEEVNELHDLVRQALVDKLGVELR
jgi:phenylalanyl-tRNA synthetase alpha chain